MLAPAPTIILRDTEGQRIESKKITNQGTVFDSFHYKFYTKDGKEVSKQQIRYFQVREDHSEREVSPFKRTTEIKIIQEAPATSINDFLETSTYELFHDENSIIDLLYQEAERYFTEDLVGIGLFSWGLGFIQYYAIIYPISREGKFVWVMKLTQAKAEYQHLMDIPTMIHVAEPPTLTQLPPLEALIAKK